MFVKKLVNLSVLHLLNKAVTFRSLVAMILKAAGACRKSWVDVFMRNRHFRWKTLLLPILEIKHVVHEFVMTLSGNVKNLIRLDVLLDLESIEIFSTFISPKNNNLRTNQLNILSSSQLCNIFT